MSETPVETPVDPAPELENPVGIDGPSLMGIQPWPSDTPPVSPTVPEPVPAQTPAELRAQAERLLAEADSLENPPA